MRWLIAVALVACACPSKQAGTPTTTTTGSGSAAPPATGCDGAAAKVSGLYRAEGHEQEAIADNTAMVMAHCAKDPPAVTACIASAKNVAELEGTCMPKLDDEGTEADVLVR